VPAKAVYLISPGYRRWLMPDFQEIEFELDGFAANDTTPLQAHLFVRDLDTEAESRSITPIDGTPKRFLLPAPKFHRRAEIICMIEHRGSKEPVCEGRLNLTNIPKEELPNLSYFDSRGVFFHEGVGRFPIIAWIEKEPLKDWKAVAAAGYTGVMIPSNYIDDKTVATAAESKLLLFPRLKLEEAKPVETVRTEIKRLMRYPAVAGYHLLFGDDRSFRADCLKACRAADPSRPLLTRVDQFSTEMTPPDLVDFEDVMLAYYPPPKGVAQQPIFARTGKTHFAFTTDLETRDDVGRLASLVRTAVARGAAGFVHLGEESNLFPMPFASAVDWSPDLVNAVVRGIPERSNDSTADHWFWRRRLGPRERAVIEVKRTDPPTATFTVFRESP
jgi:hypothetical protein